MTHDRSDLILTFRSPDRPGILAAVTACAFNKGCDIRDAQQFGDDDSKSFFIRMHLSAPAEMTPERLSAAFEPLARELELSWSLHPWKRKLRTLIAVSRVGGDSDEIAAKSA